MIKKKKKKKMFKCSDHRCTCGKMGRQKFGHC